MAAETQYETPVEAALQHVAALFGAGGGSLGTWLATRLIRTK
jgi:hypothetical protein